MKKTIAWIMAVVLLLASIPLAVTAASGPSINTKEVTIYGIDPGMEDYLTIPSNYPTSYQLKVTGATNVSYKVVNSSGYSADEVTVSSTGLVEGGYTTLYKTTGDAWTTRYIEGADSYVSDGTTYYKTTYTYWTSKYIEGAETRVDANFGDAIIKVTADSTTFDVTAHFVDYSDIYADKVMDDYIAANVTSNMTVKEKVEVACKFAAQYKYDASHSAATTMIVYGGGDCWASSDAVETMCKKMGLHAWRVTARWDAGAGSGHMDTLIEDPDNNVYYEADASYGSGYYSLVTRTSLFRYNTNDDGSGIRVYQYDAENDNVDIVVPETIDGKTVTCIGSGFAVSSDCTSVTLPSTVTEIEGATFYNCINLNKVYIPASVTEIDEDAFLYPADMLTIVCPCGSYAATYAQEKGLNYELQHSNSSKKSTTAPTCTSQGYTTYYCSSCKTEYKSNYVAALGHTTELKNKKAATCTTAGYTGDKVCKTCGATVTKGSTIAALGHTTELKNQKSATCTTAGYTGDKVCKTCGATVTKGSTIAAKGHTYKNGYCTVCKAKESGTTGARNRVMASDNILRVYGNTRYGTCLNIADKLKTALGVSKFDSVIIAYSNNFPDALSGSYLATRKHAPILIVDSLQSGDKSQTLVKNYVKNNLKSGGTIYVLGGDAAVKSSYATELQKATGAKLVTLKGDTRYDTNLAILKEAGVSGQSEILIANASTSNAFADALSASSTGKPILLVNNTKSELTSAQTSYLKSTGIKKITILGGTAAVPTSMETQLKKLGYTVNRLAGSTRYETSTKIAAKYFSKPGAVTLAWGGNFPDALCGGPLAYAIGAPVVLTQDSNTSAKTYATSLSNFKVVAFGGAGAGNQLTDTAITAVKKGTIVADLNNN